MDLNVKVKENDGKDFARCQMGTDQGSITIEGTSAFVVESLKGLLNAEGPIRNAMLEGISEFETKEQIAAIFDKALLDAGIQPST
jgi:hypothetical protein